MKIGVVITVLNEQENIKFLLDSLLFQTKKPDEIIIVDGGSTDRTLSIIKSHELNKSGSVSLFTKKGNIAVGRNFGVTKSKADLILLTDAGCILDKKWIENIVKPFVNKKVEVVAGYYKGFAGNNFQKNLIPYVLVMPDKANRNFLPSARSMAIRRRTFEKTKGFSENLNHAEDHEFSKRLKKLKVNIKFEKKAVVSWIPRSNLFSTFKMFYRYAYGDCKAGIFRGKVLLIFTRYLIFISILLILRFAPIFSLVLFFIFSVLIYVLWAVAKNYKYVQNLSAFFYLPLFQVLSDIAVMSGTANAFFLKFYNFFKSFFINNKLLSLSIAVFIFLEILNINWGLPGLNHPFNYHMDEWHQLQSVRNLFIHLSPNMSGSANGPVFNFLISGIYIALLSVLGLVNPFAINSSVSNLELQNQLFIYLRISTLIFSIGSVAILISIFKKFLKIENIFVPLILFIFSPIWIMLSGYFKYDIALIFWLLASIFLIFRFVNDKSLKNYIIAAVPVALSVSTKISALPLVIIYILSFFIFKREKNLKFIFFGLLTIFIIFCIFGIPDLFLGTGNYYEYFHSNLVQTPNETFNFNLGTSYSTYLLTNQIPTLFGFVPYFLFLVSLLYYAFNFNSNFFKSRRKKIFFILVSLCIFALSLLPLKLFIINRGLILLPFVILFVGIVWQEVIQKNNFKVLTLIIMILLFIHFVQGFSWVLTKFEDPRQVSSLWIKKNIDSGSTIGIENIPIYQFLPDIVMKEYYGSNSSHMNDLYKYEIISRDSKKFPEYVLISNADIDEHYLYKSDKKKILAKLKKMNYKKVAEFEINRKINKIFTSRLDYFISLLNPAANIYIYKK